jgi:hypothetical protein
MNEKKVKFRVPSLVEVNDIDELEVPFPWFGGKSKIATAVWQYYYRDEIPFDGSVPLTDEEPSSAYSDSKDSAGV